MKKILTVVLGFMMLSGAAFAQTQYKLDNGKLDEFVRAFPEYVSLCKKYDASADSGDPNMAIVMKYKAEFDVLLAKYGFTVEEFAMLTQKVSMGFAAAQMEKSGMDPAMAGMNMGTMISKEEIEVVKNRLPELERVFNTAAEDAGE